MGCPLHTLKKLSLHSIELLDSIEQKIIGWSLHWDGWSLLFIILDGPYYIIYVNGNGGYV